MLVKWEVLICLFEVEKLPFSLDPVSCLHFYDLRGRWAPQFPLMWLKEFI